MKFGINFPQNHIGVAPTAIRDFAQAAEEAGFDYLSAFDHVTGAHPDRFLGADIGFASPPYLYTHQFHEPFTLFSFLAGLTTRIEFVTSILILPQRQTTLVAKQAAQVALLSGGRLRLGIGVGWNFTEFEALGEDFPTRGRRVEEQIAVLRKLWTEELVTFDGRWHRLDRVGIAPRPAAPIPIWIGSGTSDRLMRRVARCADGWMPALALGADTDAVLARMRGLLAAEGRSAAAFGLQAGVSGATGGPAEWIAAARRWQALGATHLSLRGGAPDAGPMQALEGAIAVRNVLVDALEG